MKKRIYLISLGILLGLISCSKKNYVTCGLTEDLNSATIDSEIIELKRIGISDTIVANISGKIFTRYIHKKDTLTDNFPFVNIFIRDIKTDSIIGTTTNSKGEYQYTIPASKYDFEIQFIGFNNLLIKNIKIGKGDIINFSATIGQGNGVTVYKRKQDGFFEIIK